MIVAGTQGVQLYTVEELAGGVISLLDRYGIQRAHVMGMSLGGYTSQMLALTHAKRVLSIALVASEGVRYISGLTSPSPEHKRSRKYLKLPWSRGLVHPPAGW